MDTQLWSGWCELLIGAYEAYENHPLPQGVCFNNLIMKVFLSAQCQYLFVLSVYKQTARPALVQASVCKHYSDIQTVVQGFLKNVMHYLYDSSGQTRQCWVKSFKHLAWCGCTAPSCYHIRADTMDSLISHSYLSCSADGYIWLLVRE